MLGKRSAIAKTEERLRQSEEKFRTIYESFLRADDTEKTIKNRIRVYHKATAPLVDYYRKKEALVQVNGDQSIEDVFKEIEAVLAGG